MSGKRVYCECPYNVGIICEKTICRKGEECGWYPMTEKSRKAKIKNSVFPHLRLPVITRPIEPQKRERGDYGAERRARLRAEGKCPICGKENDRPDKWCCTACYKRKRELEKVRNATMPE